VPRQHCSIWLMVGDAADHVAQIGFGIEAVESGRLDGGVHCGRPASPAIEGDKMELMLVGWGDVAMDILEVAVILGPLWQVFRLRHDIDGCDGKKEPRVRQG